jgi:DNA-binding SARP family transcriptional activator
MKAPSKQRTLIGLLYDNPSRSFSVSELMGLLRIQSHQSVVRTVCNLRRAGANIQTIMSTDDTRYKIVI